MDRESATEDQKVSKQPLWFVAAVIVLFWNFWEGNYGGSVGYSLGALVLPIILAVAGIRTYIGKRAYFLRMFAVAMTILFALYIFTM